MNYALINKTWTLTANDVTFHKIILRDDQFGNEQLTEIERQLKERDERSDLLRNTFRCLCFCSSSLFDEHGRSISPYPEDALSIDLC